MGLDRARTNAQAATSQFQAKVDALQRKADREQGEARAAVEARIAKLRQDFERRQSA